MVASLCIPTTVAWTTEVLDHYARSINENSLLQQVCYRVSAVAIGVLLIPLYAVCTVLPDLLQLTVETISNENTLRLLKVYSIFFSIIAKGVQAPLQAACSSLQSTVLADEKYKARVLLAELFSVINSKFENYTSPIRFVMSQMPDSGRAARNNSDLFISLLARSEFDFTNDSGQYGNRIWDETFDSFMMACYPGVYTSQMSFSNQRLRIQQSLHQRVVEMFTQSFTAHKTEQKKAFEKIIVAAMHDARKILQTKFEYTDEQFQAVDTEALYATYNLAIYKIFSLAERKEDAVHFSFDDHKIVVEAKCNIAFDGVDLIPSCYELINSTQKVAADKEQNDKLMYRLALKDGSDSEAKGKEEEPFYEQVFRDITSWRIRLEKSPSELIATVFS